MLTALLTWLVLSILLILALLRVIVRGTKRPHKPLQSGATPLPATNFYRHCPSCGCSGNTVNGNQCWRCGFNLPAHSHTNAGSSEDSPAQVVGGSAVAADKVRNSVDLESAGGCGDGPEPEKLTALAGSSPAPCSSPDEDLPTF